MNKKKIDEVGELLEIDSSVIKESKTRTFLKRFTYPLVQVAFFIVSSISGLLFGYWENSVHTGYPFTSYIRIYRAGVPVFLFIHSGNAVFSSITHKKYGLSKFHTASTIISNLILSFLSFIFLYEFVYRDPFFGYAVRYGSYKRKKIRVKHSIVFFVKEKSIKYVVDD